MTTYRAAPAHGRAWLLGMFAFVALISLPAFVVPLLPLRILMAVTMGPIGLIFLTLAWWYPSIRYELGAEELVLRFGPFRYPIPLGAIQSVSKRNLALGLQSSFRLPGFAMWTVAYADIGNVFMCATRALEDIIIIDMGKKKYGVTPADETAFVANLTQRLKG